MTRSSGRGHYSVLIVAPESLDSFDGHLPRVARLIRSSRLFSKLIKRVHIDEAHNIYTAGTSLYGVSAYRPAYGLISKQHVFLEKGTPFQALSGTLPPHITKAIVDNLGFPSNYATITFTANRPNITYAAQPVVGSLSDFRNLDFVVPPKHKTIIFFDSKIDARNAAIYLDNHVNLPESQRGRGVVQEYHGDMSPQYLTQVFEAFAAEYGQNVLCILCATATCSTGIDIADVASVIQSGISRDVPDWRQRGGRAGRDPAIPAIFLTLYEPWVAEVDLTKVLTDVTDPDKPLLRLTKNSTKQEHTGFASIHFLQSSECTRLLLAQYFGDTTPSRIDFTNPWCCDHHPGQEIDFSVWFTTPFFDDKVPGNTKATVRKPRSRIPVRPKKDRGALISRLQQWRLDMHRSDPLRAFRTMAMIINDKSISLIAGIAPQRVSVEVLMEKLGEVEEWEDSWADKIVKVIQEYDTENSGSELEVESEDSSDEEPLLSVLRRGNRLD
ncbi:hypothetical protein EVG20_g10774 [Dentipellis fragilis]|uniref:DNA 3'-5' helicase n=1 Tax=Dentipellis fragilis TaxID=205917 RepID=A0A4Y9XRC4_9AGAM|nr:hypothetical protein EVG20_g10774 [Dentipellis fragilis]